MPEFRFDPFSGRHVIIVADRATRPHEFDEQVVVDRDVADCPFCHGNESETPQAVAEYRLSKTAASDQHWDVRVVPNLYPAVSPEHPPARTRSNAAEPAHGQHEVIIESSSHVTSFGELTDEQARLVFDAYRDRLLAASKAPHVVYAHLFKNCRPQAGASIEHIHSQLVALPFVPSDIQLELDASRRHFQQQGDLLMREMLDRELAQRERIILESANLVAFCPYASRFAYECWLVPRNPLPRFESSPSDLLAESAVMLRRIVNVVEKKLDLPAYNYYLRSAPFDSLAGEHYHWYFTLFPRLAKAAGFEIGTGCFINTTPPEVAAAEFRNLLLGEPGAS